MEYLALYRKYRPKTFDNVIGQYHITTTLKNQIMNEQISHAYLFTGTRGTGKTSVAKIFATSINCEHPINGSACGKCNTCIALNEPNNMDVLEIDAASNNRVDEIRELREKVKYPPVNGKYKVYIIDEVHMLTDSAFNALLKTLEEPPAYVVFILATTEVHKIPATILSRCMRFDFKLVPQTELEKHIKTLFEDSKILYEDTAISLIASLGEGSVRDALSIADMCVAYTNKNVTYNAVLECVGAIDKNTIIKLASDILSGNYAQILQTINTTLSLGKSATQIAKDLTIILRDLAIIKTVENYTTILNYPQELLNKLMEVSKKVELESIMNVLTDFSSLENDFRNSTNPRLVLEVMALTSFDTHNKPNNDTTQKKTVNVKNISTSNSIIIKKDLENSLQNVQGFNDDNTVIKKENDKADELNSNYKRTPSTEIDNVISEFEEYRLFDNSTTPTDIDIPNNDQEVNFFMDDFDDSEQSFEYMSANFGVLDSNGLMKVESISAKTLFGRLVLDLRKRKEFSTHAMVGIEKNYKLINDTLILYVADSFKVKTLNEGDKNIIINNILKSYAPHISFKAEIKNVKNEKFDKKQHLINIFGKSLQIVK